MGGFVSMSTEESRKLYEMLGRGQVEMQALNEKAIADAAKWAEKETQYLAKIKALEEENKTLKTELTKLRNQDNSSAATEKQKHQPDKRVNRANRGKDNKRGGFAVEYKKNSQAAPPPTAADKKSEEAVASGKQNTKGNSGKGGNTGAQAKGNTKNANSPGKTPQKK